MSNSVFNKIAGAVLTAGVIALGAGFVAEVLVPPSEHPNRAAHTAIHIEVPEEGGAVAAEDPAIATLLASADAAKGEASVKACMACHNFKKDGSNGIGPALWGVVGREKGKHAGYAYSTAMSEAGGNWGYDELYHFLKKPSAYIKGTKMSYSGMSKPETRANVIAYLRTLSDSPLPLPTAEEKAEPKPESKSESDDATMATPPAAPAEPATASETNHTPEPAAEIIAPQATPVAAEKPVTAVKEAEPEHAEPEHVKPESSEHSN